MLTHSPSRSRSVTSPQTSCAGACMSIDVRTLAMVASCRWDQCSYGGRRRRDPFDPELADAVGAEGGTRTNACSSTRRFPPESAKLLWRFGCQGLSTRCPHDDGQLVG